VPINTKNSQTISGVGSISILPTGGTATVLPFPLSSYYACPYDGNFSGLSFAQTKVDEFSTMPRGWDGYGAEAIGAVTGGHTKNALSIFSVQLPMPDIIPNSNGTLSLEWETKAGAAHLEIGRTKCSLYIRPADNANPLYFSGTPLEVDGGVAALLHASLYAPLEPPTPINQVSGSGCAR
jgi:hypothetical protein